MTAPRHRTYEQCGLRLRSTIPLPLREVEAGRAHVEVRRGAPLDTAAVPPGEVLASMDTGDGRRWYTATDDGERIRLRFHGCGEFVLDHALDQVMCRPDPEGSAELLPVLLAGTVTAFLLLLRGRTVLHASAVAGDAGALAFVGQSGRGKTTMAALLCAAGAKLVADDLLVVDEGPPVRCLGGSVELRLREAARPLAEAFPASAGRRETEDARLGLRAAAIETRALPLAAIVIPSPSRTATRVDIERVGPADAVFWLLSFPRVTGMTRADLVQRQFEALTQIATEVPVYRAEIPWGPPFAPAIADELRRLAA